MTISRLARRLGLDRNPMRRRTDKIATCLLALLVAAVLIGTPVVSIVAIGWGGRSAADGQQSTRSWRQVPAIVQKAAPAPPAWQPSGYSWVPARWTAPDGRARTGQIPVSVAVTAGQVVPLWVDGTGMPTGPPPSRRAVLADEAAAVAVALAGLGVVLLCLTCAVQWVLDRRRLAGWEAGWAAVGPQWTKRFQSRG